MQEHFVCSWLLLYFNFLLNTFSVHFYFLWYSFLELMFLRHFNYFVFTFLFEYILTIQSLLVLDVSLLTRNLLVQIWQ